MPDSAGRVSNTQQRGWDAGVTLVVQGHPLTFLGSSRLPRSKVVICEARLSFSLFYLIMNNTKVSSKIPLPHYITVYNTN